MPLQEKEIQGFLVAQLAGLLGQEVPQDQPFMEAGLDSLAAVELRNTLSSKFSLDLPASLLFDYPTIASLSSFLLASMRPAEAPKEMSIEAFRPSDLQGSAVVGMACHYPSGKTGEAS